MNSAYELWRQISFFDHNDTSHRSLTCRLLRQKIAAHILANALYSTAGRSCEILTFAKLNIVVEC
ncbi:hypothetical protein T07_1260 [Trichinella nelsoni]|uniref:Uncharacterized protein n=1 Tax=Trichinella nelsoni TaxID=6336 RepID=A0A0V0S5E3_9BILA|nr:hypothetical protein T07_1260 [Trichinella nelsoni]